MTGSFSRLPRPAHTSGGPGNIDLTPRLGLCKTGVKSSSYIEWDISSIMLLNFKRIEMFKQLFKIFLIPVNEKVLQK